MTELAYLAVVLASTVCVAMVDRRWRLALWAHARRTAAVLAIAVAVFLVWDVLALELGYYTRGESRFMTGIEVSPGLPLEELFFVLFLCYITLVLHRGVRRLRDLRRPVRESVS